MGLTSGSGLRAAVDADDDFNRALDATASILRTLSAFRIAIVDQDDTSEAQALEQWARHILVLTPGPNGPTNAKTGGRRDWPGLCQYLKKGRKAETDAVNLAVSELRKTIWDLVEGLNTTVLADTTCDRDLRSQIVRLRQAAEGDSLEVLRREALGVASSLTSLIEARRKTQESMLESLAARVKNLSEELEQARAEGAQDALTKVYNRRAFDDYVERVIALDGLFGKPACLLMVDIDHFKKINDQHGHPTGDEVLRKIGEALTRTFPRKTDFVSRYGGEEFAIILRDTRIHDGKMLSGRVLESIRKIEIPKREGSLRVTASLGVAQLGASEAASAWIERADKALYEAKNGGRNQWVASE